MQLDITYNGEIVPIHISSYSHGSAARTYGPPENCYPEEPPEMEWEPISKDKDLNQFINDLSDDEKWLIEEQIWHMITEYEREQDEPPDFNDRYYSDSRYCDPF